MKIIVGLGNPGKKYANTRHNAGFLFVDKLQEENKENFDNWRFEKKFDAETSTGILNKEKVTLVKPQTFMNNSGQSVAKIVDFYKLDTEKDLIIIRDDIDLELSKVRTKKDSSAGGHKGIKSIINLLGTKNFTQIKIGVGGRIKGEWNTEKKVEDYVLENFSKEEKKTINHRVEEKVKKLDFLNKMHNQQTKGCK